MTKCYLIEGEKIFLSEKKQGIGIGNLNGFGGKVEDGEEIEDVTIREVQEEIGVSVSKDHLEKVALIKFF